MVVDVVVVGAGLSGLRAAVEVHRAGLTCVVLEAMDRVGGKVLSVDAAPALDGQGEGSRRKVVDLGAAWINDTSQSEMLALASRFKLDLIEQRIAGRYLRQERDGSVVQYPLGFGEDMEDPQVIGVYQMIKHLSESWLGPDAKAFDSVTFKALAEANFPDNQAVGEAADFLAGALLGVGADEISALFMIEHTKSGTGLENMASDLPDGGQYLRVRQGAQSFATGLERLLPRGTVHLKSPVTKITQNLDGGCITTTDKGSIFHSKKVIMSLPTPLHNTVIFDPPLPGARQELAERTALGYHAKVVLVFASPWWREARLSGVMESTTTGPIAFTRDTCSEEDGQYSITCFMVGQRGREWSDLGAAEREEQVLEHFYEVFRGALPEDDLPRPVNVIEKEWTKDPWIRGGPTPVMPPDLFDTTAGAALYVPFRDVHFVGAEMADVWRGYMEGAVRSGISGAEEVIGHTLKALKLA
ncbi:putative amine oxidase [Lasiosphaeria ovina]|uniref:Amine oxidase n=1 Tax=Lasiosphaeria ovina TaxID=92902 RepID=A0AAE0MZ15_9PEZI|nr:putative amine oxidase [Lasiosphaeria ovina]